MPVALFSTSDGTAAREGLRRFLHTALAPLAMLVQTALRVALQEPDLLLDLSALGAADLGGKARAVGQLVAAGTDLDDALDLVGLA